MDEEHEQAYVQGGRAIWTQLLRQCIGALGYEDMDIARLIAEREAAISLLRQVCAEHGDNDWDESLHLYDILEKHLYNHLSA